MDSTATHFMETLCPLIECTRAKHVFDQVFTRNDYHGSCTLKFKEGADCAYRRPHYFLGYPPGCRCVTSTTVSVTAQPDITLYRTTSLDNPDDVVKELLHE